jgi:hypothetical protein
MMHKSVEIDIPIGILTKEIKEYDTEESNSNPETGRETMNEISKIIEEDKLQQINSDLSKSVLNPKTNNLPLINPNLIPQNKILPVHEIPSNIPKNMKVNIKSSVDYSNQDEQSGNVSEDNINLDLK